jgi:hypothetical protein
MAGEMKSTTSFPDGIFRHPAEIKCGRSHSIQSDFIRESEDWVSIETKAIGEGLEKIGNLPAFFR